MAKKRTTQKKSSQPRGKRLESKMKAWLRAVDDARNTESEE